MKIWLISDTHGKESGLKVPENIDMVIHAGDSGTVREPIMNAKVIEDFLDWYKSLNIKHKVFIAGNHDTSLEKGYISKGDIPFGIDYLEHECKLIGGLKIFGSPYTPTFGTDWAFNVKRSKLDAYWAEIEEGTDIVITHGPPLGILDHTESGTSNPIDYVGGETWGNTNVVSCGDKSLLNHIRRVNPQLHVFGHIHNEDRCCNAAIMQIHGIRTKFVNASVLNLDYKIDNNGFIIEI
jgi:Icc-related predicted phosphoesterase